MSEIERAKVLPKTGQPSKTTLNTCLMHQTQVELAYRHVASKYRCDIKIAFLYTLIYRKTCWKTKLKNRATTIY